MARKNNVTEVLGPVDPAPNVRAQLEAFIEHKIAEMMGGDAGVFEPFFQPKKIADEIRKLQTVPQQRKWHDYYLEWGCLVCQKKNWPHTSNGMCQACHSRTLARLKTILRSTENERSDSSPFTPDRLTELASGAVRKQLSGEASGLETHAYVTKAERKAQREKATREALLQAQTLHADGLTWKAVTQRLDPSGFANDPERAIERLRIAVQKYVPPAVRKLGYAKIARRKQERSASRKEIWRQARALHVEQKLTWREIAQRLDSDFDKNPKAAIARIRNGSASGLARARPHRSRARSGPKAIQKEFRFLTDAD